MEKKELKMWREEIERDGKERVGEGERRRKREIVMSELRKGRDWDRERKKWKGECWVESERWAAGESEREMERKELTMWRKQIFGGES